MKGILFKPWKTQFIAEHPGMEIQTRRLGGLKEINKKPNAWYCSGFNTFQYYFVSRDTGEVTTIKPRYQVGKTVYIKERALYWVSPILEGVKYDKPSDWWTDCVYQDDPEIPALLADNGRLVLERSINQIVEGSPIVGKWEWKSSMFMPEHYARYFPVITDVRAERLQEITPHDCILEGIIEEYGDGLALRDKFEEPWNSINPKYPWGSNPWVWAYTLRLKEKT